MAGYTRVDTSNNIADGNVISAADLDNEFDGVQAAFNASTGHTHGGGVGEGAPITKLGPTNDVTISATLLAPKTTNTVDIGSSSLKYKDLYLAGNASIAGTLGIAGVTTFTAQPVLSSLTASRAVFTDGSKGLVSNAITGTGNVVMSAAPTLTGTITAEALTLSGAVTLSGGTANGVAYLNGSKVLTTGSALTFDGTNFGVGVSAPYGGVYATIHAFSAGGATLRLDRTGAGTSTIQSIETGTAYRDLTLDAANNIFNISGSEQMRLTSTGLGIGTSSPGYKLDVVDTGGNLFRFTRNTEQLGSYVSAGNVYFGTLSNNPLLLMTNGTVKATLDSSGNLGLGVTPSAWFSGWSPAFEMRSFALASDANTNYICNNAVFGSDTIWRYVASKYALHTEMDAATGQHRWYTAPSGTAGNAISFTQAMTLDASGNLGIGLTSSAYRLAVTAPVTYGNTEDGNIAINGNASGGSTSNPTTVGGIVFGSQNTANSYAGRLAVIQDNPSAGTQTHMRFYTNSGGGNGGCLERARIDSSGNLLVGLTTPHYSSNTFFREAGANFPALTLFKNSSAASSDNAFVIMNGNNGGTNSFVVLASGNALNTNNSYGSLSDVRLKENIQDVTPKLADLMNVRIRHYHLIADKEKQKQVGVVADELEEVFPGLVATGGDGFKSVKYSVFVPMLIKAIQEQQALIQTLTARVQALEAA